MLGLPQRENSEEEGKKTEWENLRSQYPSMEGILD
jgi:hypothetical protein